MWTKHVVFVEESVTAQVVKQQLCSKKLKEISNLGDLDNDVR